ncbi:hypothetical protein Tco_1336080 [Tanacetum coccineum]
MTTNNSVLHGPLKKKLHCAKLGFVLSKLSLKVAVSGAGDGDYTQQALLEYQAGYGVLFTLKHCWKELKDYEKWKPMAGDDEEDVQEVQRPMDKTWQRRNGRRHRHLHYLEMRKRWLG